MVKQIRPVQLAEMIAAGEPLILVDVRQPDEHAFAALPNSTLIPLGELSSRFGEIDRPDGALVVVYCHHGVRSLKAATFLEMSGVAPVASLAGGIEAWSLTIDATVPRY